MIRALLRWFLALLLAWPAAALAAPPELRATAEAHVDAAVLAANREDWELAELEYRAALAIAERFEPRDAEVEATLLNNLSRINERLGKFRLAIDQARLSMQKSTTMDVRERDEHEGRIARMTALLTAQPDKIERPPAQIEQPPAQIEQPPRQKSGAVQSARRLAGPIALTATGAAMLVVGIGCASGLPAAVDGLQGALTLVEIDRLTSRARVLEGLAIGFGTAGILATVGGVVWLRLTRSHSH